MSNEGTAVPQQIPESEAEPQPTILKIVIEGMKR